MRDLAEYDNLFIRAEYQAQGIKRQNYIKLNKLTNFWFKAEKISIIKSRITCCNQKKYIESIIWVYVLDLSDLISKVHNLAILFKSLYQQLINTNTKQKVYLLYLTTKLQQIKVYLNTQIQILLLQSSVNKSIHRIPIEYIRQIFNLHNIYINQSHSIMSISVPHPTVAPQDPTIILEDQTFVIQDITQLPDQKFILPDQAKRQDLTFSFQNNQRISSHQQINTPDTNQKPKPQTQKDLNQAQTGCSQKSICSLKIAGILMFLAVVATGIIIGSYFRYKPSIKPKGLPTKINFEKGNSFIMNQYKLQKKNFMKPDTEINLLISANVPAAQQNGARRLLQQQQSNNNEYNVTVDLHQQGLQLVLSSDDKLGIFIEPTTFIKSLSQDDHNQTRLLADTNQTDHLNQSQLYSEIQKQMSKIFNDELSSNGSFQFKEIPMVEFKLNDTTGTFDIVNENKSDVNKVRRLWSLKKIVNKIKDVANKIVKPVIENIRKHGQLIGAASGALIGGAIGTFILPGIGTWAGAKLGSKIGGAAGLAAQTFVKACMPQNKLKIHCNSQSISTALFDASKSIAQGQIINGGAAMIPKPQIITKLGGSGILRAVRK